MWPAAGTNASDTRQKRTLGGECIHVSNVPCIWLEPVLRQSFRLFGIRKLASFPICILGIMHKGREKSCEELRGSVERIMPRYSGIRLLEPRDPRRAEPHV